MRRYLTISSGGHLLLLALWVSYSALLSKPRKSYYSIDLVSSLPAGGVMVTPGGGAPKIVEEAPKAPPPINPAVEERRRPAKEVIKVQGKPKKTPPPPQASKKQGLNLKAALAVLDNQGKGQGKGTGGRVGIPGGTGAGVSAQAGQPFPYPWYLKVITERLDQKWSPPSEFSPDTECTVDFVIHKDGQIADISISKTSGDATFNELARRAVLYSNPLPPLPAGYPDDTLNVHMSFQGK